MPGPTVTPTDVNATESSTKDGGIPAVFAGVGGMMVVLIVLILIVILILFLVRKNRHQKNR